MIVLGAGLVLMLVVGAMGFAMALSPALLVSYGVALAVLGKVGVWQRLGLQLLILLFALAGLTVLCSIGLFVGFEGNMGSTLTLWGRDLFDQPIVLASLATVPFFVAAGEVAMWRRRKGFGPSSFTPRRPTRAPSASD